MGSWYGKAKKATNEAIPKKPASAVQKPQAEITQKDRAVLDLKNARDKIRRFRGQMEKDSQKLEAQARALIAARQKTRALLVLKLKRHKEKELEKLEGQLLNVYAMIQDVEWASINQSVLASIEAGTQELKRIHEERSVEDVEALMEETLGAIEVEKKINRLLAGQGDVAIDDADLERELDDLMRASETSAAALPSPLPSPPLTLPEPPTIPPLPTAPTGPLPERHATKQPTAVPS